MTESVKILTADYLDWHAKLIGLPSILTDKFRSKLYKRYEKETGNEPWQLSEVVISISEKTQASDFKPITFEARPDPELIIKSILEHFTYLKFRNSFRGIDNYNITSPQPWSSPCPICNGKHGNYGLHGEWYRNRTEYCLNRGSDNSIAYDFPKCCIPAYTCVDDSENGCHMYNSQN